MFRLSTGLQNAEGGALGILGALNAGRIEVYSGAQPATADSAVTGTLLGTITVSAAALTKETRATATLTVTATDGSALTAVKVGTLPIVDDVSGITADASTTVTAAVIANAINRSGMAEATASGAVVTVKPRPGFGAKWNGLALATTGLACTGTNFASGVAAVNALYASMPAAGVIAKPAAVEWKMLGLAIGTAGYFRWYGSDTADSGATVSGAPYYPRLDGNCGVGSGDMRLSTLSVVVSGPVVVQSVALTLLAQ